MGITGPEGHALSRPEEVRTPHSAVCNHQVLIPQPFRWDRTAQLHPAPPSFCSVLSTPLCSLLPAPSQDSEDTSQPERPEKALPKPESRCITPGLCTCPNVLIWGEILLKTWYMDDRKIDCEVPFKPYLY